MDPDRPRRPHLPAAWFSLVTHLSPCVKPSSNSRVGTPGRRQGPAGVGGHAWLLARLRSSLCFRRSANVHSCWHPGRPGHWNRMELAWASNNDFRHETSPAVGRMTTIIRSTMVAFSFDWDVQCFESRWKSIPGSKNLRWCFCSAITEAHAMQWNCLSLNATYSAVV